MSNKAWEYKRTGTFSEEEFNELGNQGWELVSVDRDHAWFKRVKWLMKQVNSGE